MITFRPARLSKIYMNYELLISRDPAEWSGAVALMQSTLDAMAGKIGLRQSEATDALSVATSNLLDNDCKALRTAHAKDSKAFIKKVAINAARNIVAYRQARQSREITLDHVAMNRLLEYAPV